MSSEKLIRNIGRYRRQDFIINYDIKYRMVRDAETDAPEKDADQ